MDDRPDFAALCLSTLIQAGREKPAGLGAGSALPAVAWCVSGAGFARPDRGLHGPPAFPPLAIVPGGFVILMMIQ